MKFKLVVQVVETVLCFVAMELAVSMVTSRAVPDLSKQPLMFMKSGALRLTTELFFGTFFLFFQSKCFIDVPARSTRVRFLFCLWLVANTTLP